MDNFELNPAAAIINDTLLKAVDKKTKVGIYCGIDYINFNFHNNQIIIPKGRIIYRDNCYDILGPVTLPITNFSDGISCVWYDTVENTYITAHRNDWGVGIVGNDNLILIATYWYTAKTVFGPSGPYIKTV